MKTNTHLFLFTFGPVQSFISQARKPQDLYAGSQMLTSLCKAALEYVCVAPYNAKKIFPANKENNSKSLPNRFLVEIQGEHDWKQLGATTESVVRLHWKEIAENALKNLSKPSGFDQQIEQHLEIFWAIEPYTDDYRAAYLRLEATIGAIKNIRQFRQFKDPQNGFGEIGRKCSLDGIRNVKFYRMAPGADEQAVLAKNLFQRKDEVCLIPDHNKNIGKSILKTREGLSAVSFVKRVFDTKTDSIPSTAEFAFMHSLHQAMRHENPEIKKSISDYLCALYPNKKPQFENVITYEGFRKYINGLTRKQFNWQFFYEESIRSIEALQKLGYDNISNSTFSEIRKTYREMLNNLRSVGIALNKYYALVIFDGDNIGKWLGGDPEYLADTVDLKLFHTKLSEALSDYAQTTMQSLGDTDPKILSLPDGKTIYAGGDDFLGFLNLHALCEKLSTLRFGFEQKVNQALKNIFGDAIKKSFTFSAGVVIAHYKTPLSTVLKEARRTQEKAKNDFRNKKNALAIGVLKRSGEQLSFKLKWNFKHQQYSKPGETLHPFDQLIQFLRQRKLSPKFAYVLRREFNPLLNKKGEFKWHHRTITTEVFFEREFHRLMIQHKANTVSVESIKTLAINLLALRVSRAQKRQLNNFLSMLDTAVFISRHTTEIEQVDETKN